MAEEKIKNILTDRIVVISDSWNARTKTTWQSSRHFLQTNYVESTVFFFGVGADEWQGAPSTEKHRMLLKFIFLSYNSSS